MGNAILFNMKPEAAAYIFGSSQYPDIEGFARFYKRREGTVVAVQVKGLPASAKPCEQRIFGFHIHEGGSCTGNASDPFADTGSHYNPYECDHPEHAGDLPPLFGDSTGYAMEIFYTGRFEPQEVVGRTIVIHDMPDDFKTQPSGGSGTKIACGEIFQNPQ